MEVYNTSKSEICRKHQWSPNGQSEDVITDKDDDSTERLSSCTSSDTHPNTLHNQQQQILLPLSIMVALVPRNT